jgi:hypothetical protein
MGRMYYVTTLGAWRRSAHRIVSSHYVCLDLASSPDSPPNQSVTARNVRSVDDDVRILVLVEADESGHNFLEQDPEWESLPHPLSQKALSDTVERALAGQGIASSATTFDVSESLGRTHPLLRYRVF